MRPPRAISIGTTRIQFAWNESVVPKAWRTEGDRRLNTAVHIILSTGTAETAKCTILSNLSFSVFGLNPGTIYHFRFCLFNSNLEQSYTAEDFFATCPLIFQIKTKTSNPSTTILKWQALTHFTETKNEHDMDVWYAVQSCKEGEEQSAFETICITQNPSCEYVIDDFKAFDVLKFRVLVKICFKQYLEPPKATEFIPNLESQSPSGSEQPFYFVVAPNVPKVIDGNHQEILLGWHDEILSKQCLSPDFIMENLVIQVQYAEDKGYNNYKKTRKSSCQSQCRHKLYFPKGPKKYLGNNALTFTKHIPAEFKIKGLKPGCWYWLRLRCWLKEKASMSISNEIAAACAAMPPGIPKSLQQKHSIFADERHALIHVYINLCWKDARNNGAPIRRYYVQRLVNEPSEKKSREGWITVYRGLTPTCVVSAILPYPTVQTSGTTRNIGKSKLLHRCKFRVFAENAVGQGRANMVSVTLNQPEICFLSKEKNESTLQRALFEGGILSNRDDKTRQLFRDYFGSGSKTATNRIDTMNIQKEKAPKAKVRQECSISEKKRKECNMLTEARKMLGPHNIKKKCASPPNSEKNHNRPLSTLHCHRKVKGAKLAHLCPKVRKTTVPATSPEEDQWVPEQAEKFGMPSYALKSGVASWKILRQNLKNEGIFWTYSDTKDSVDTESEYQRAPETINKDDIIGIVRYMRKPHTWSGKARRCKCSSLYPDIHVIQRKGSRLDTNSISHKRAISLPNQQNISEFSARIQTAESKLASGYPPALKEQCFRVNQLSQTIKIQRFWRRKSARKHHSKLLSICDETQKGDTSELIEANIIQIQAAYRQHLCKRLFTRHVESAKKIQSFFRTRKQHIQAYIKNPLEADVFELNRVAILLQKNVRGFLDRRMFEKRKRKVINSIREIKISGAGSKSVNGKYVNVGISNGGARFIYSDIDDYETDYILERAPRKKLMMWVISSVSAQGKVQILYANTGKGATSLVPPTLGWALVNGKAPLPQLKSSTRNCVSNTNNNANIVIVMDGGCPNIHGEMVACGKSDGVEQFVSVVEQETITLKRIPYMKDGKIWVVLGSQSTTVVSDLTEKATSTNQRVYYVNKKHGEMEFPPSAGWVSRAE